MMLPARDAPDVGVAVALGADGVAYRLAPELDSESRHGCAESDDGEGRRQCDVHAHGEFSESFSRPNVDGVRIHR